MRDVSQLHPELQEKVHKLRVLCEKEGLELGIGECLRTVAEQNELYAQGRTKPGPIVTYAPGTSYSSQHQWGIAFDFFRNVPGHAYDSVRFFRRVAALAKSLGLAWGGDWDSPVDMPHLYLPNWGDTPSPLKRQYGTPDNFMRTWRTVKTATGKTLLDVDGWCGPATVRRLQEHAGTPADGIISDQWLFYKDANPGLVSVEWVPNPSGNSAIVKWLQRKVGVTEDGIIGPDTISAMQRWLGTPVDGCISAPSACIKALQTWLNGQDE